jgi:hypothetical protein
MNKLPSYLRRGPGGGKPVNRRSPMGLLPGEPPARLRDRVVEVLRTRHRRFLAMPREGLHAGQPNKS